MIAFAEAMAKYSARQVALRKNHQLGCYIYVRIKIRNYSASESI